MLVRLLLGDCMKRMAEMEEGSVGIVCCDPPYGLEFMGKDWDAPWKYTINNHGFTDGGDRIPAPSFTSTRNPTCKVCGKRKRTWDGGPPACACKVPEFDDVEHRVSDMQAFQMWSSLWLTEVYRVLQPGGMFKTFGGTRVFHRLAAAMDDVGFTDIKLDSWGYGSGFPKSLNVAKALDKMAGAKRGTKQVPFTGNAVLRAGGQNTRPWMEEALKKGYHEMPDDTAVSDNAKLWEGWGTALKPAWEPVLIGTKPGASP